MVGVESDDSRRSAGRASASRGRHDRQAAPSRSTRLIDLSHRIEPGMVTYPGLPGPSITPHLTREASRAHYAPGTEFAIDWLTLLGNTGTYLDSPFHRFADGADLSGLPVERLADLPVALVRVPATVRAVDVEHVHARAVAGHAVLVHTGWDVHWRTPQYGGPAPFLTAGACGWLVENGAALVGIDSVNIDDTADPTRPAHTLLLAAGIPLVEHLTGLGGLPDVGARFTAVPPAVVGFGTFPVRAFATVTEDQGPPSGAAT